MSENGAERRDITGRIKTVQEAHELLPVVADMWRNFKRMRLAFVAVVSIAIAGYVTAEYFHRFADGKEVEELKTRTTIIETRMSDMAENVRNIGRAVGAHVKE